MSIRDRQARYDGFQAILEGVDSGRSPAVLGRGQLAWAVNATTRGGFVMCRPGWSKLALTFADSTVEANFKTGGRWQGAGAYVTDDGKASLIASIGGRIFEINTSTLAVQDLSTIYGLVNSPVQPQAWFQQAENYLIIQNASDKALIYDGSVLRQSAYPEVAEVPPGSCMEYNNGRLWVAAPDGAAFVAGDLAYSRGNRSDVLGFTENTYLNGGGSFVVPSSAGKIVAMRSVAVQDSVTGQGPLQVLTTRGSFSINAPFDRDEWQNTRNPIQTISMLAAGAVAQNSVVNVNGDLWFRAPDGVRSFVIARRDHGTWVNTPMSREVSRALDYDSPELLDHSSAVLFDNRLLVTTAPARSLNGSTQRGVVHSGLAVLDFAPVSQMFNRSQPVWEGVWTGLSILQLASIDSPSSRCFIFTLNSSYEIELWELSRSARFDGASGRIEWSFETPSYGFDTGGWNLRELGYADLWLDRLAGETSFTAYYREDGYPFWREWHSWSVCATYQDCDHDPCTTPSNFQEQYRARKRLPSPSSECDTVSGKPSTHLYRVQARLAVTGFARIRQMRLTARDVPEDAEGAC